MCGIFKMKIAVIYINLWYFECEQQQMGFDVFLIDSMNIHTRLQKKNE